MLVCGWCRVLKTWHKVAGDKVIALMGYDLVSAKTKWAAGIKDLREMFTRVEQDGFNMQSQAVWRLHWDHQIHKANTLKQLSTTARAQLQTFRRSCLQSRHTNPVLAYLK